MAFQKATKKQAKGRLALVGPSGSGKTYTALRVAKALGERVAVIDSERGSASKYADKFDFDVCELDSFSPEAYIKAIGDAEDAGYDVLIIDSLSHAWQGTGGALEMVDNATKRANSNNAFTSGWREVTPIHNRMIDAIMNCACHVIVTMRVKTEYVLEDKGGKKIPRKIGLAPIQRQGMEYEFDVLCDLNHEFHCIVSKTRCDDLAEKVFKKAGEDDLGFTFAKWLDSGEEAPPATLTKADMEKVKFAIKSRLKELDMDVADAPIVGADIMREFAAFGVERPEDLPRSELPNITAYALAWEPKDSEEDFNQDPGEGSEGKAA